jgi:polyhydroxyalkanoate synthase
MSESNEAAAQAQLAEKVAEALADIQQHVLANAAKPFTQGAGQIDANTVLQQLAQDFVRNPQRWHFLQQEWYQRQLALWMSAASNAGEASPGQAEQKAAPILDRRFRGPEWHAPFFRWLSQSYLITSQWMEGIASGVELMPHDKKRAAFKIRQWIDAASPANYLWSNPEALKLAADTKGASLAQGLQNLRADLPKGMVSMTDESAFEIGKNIATTPGDVVFENDVLQLIQYRPLTDEVYSRPLLMVPPCINKFYILDLQAENSLARFCVEQGHTTFMVSWRNVPPECGKLTWDDYVSALIDAIEAMRDICGVQQINGLAFCVGGTLLACALAVLKKSRKHPVASVALLATMLDFCDTGELSVFIDEAYVERREREFALERGGGILPGRELAVTFATLRANDLIWNYVVNNYLKGKTPPAFDLLYWNCDSTNLPGPMYAWYIRHTYLENNLRTPDKLTVCGKPLDLSALDLPTYLLATREDHIVPWKTAYASTKLLKGDLTFVLSASGHIAGIVNPARANKRNYWVNEDLSTDADTWLGASKPVPGSWWNHWAAWAAPHGGGKVPARKISGSKKYPVIEPGPGRYVHAKAEPPTTEEKS